MKKYGYKTTVIVLLFCVSLTGGMLTHIWGSAEEAGILFSDDFNRAALDNAWVIIYGKNNNSLSLDTGRQALKYTMADTDGQHGPQRNFSLTEIGLWGGQKITISWKCIAEASGVGVRLNYTSDGNEANIFGGGDGAPIRTDRWTEYSVELEFSEVMASKPFNFMFKLPGAPTTVYFKDFMITGKSSPPVITTETLPGGALTVPYEYKLRATGGAPFVWTVIEGSLPAGLFLSDDGVISGMPGGAGESVFTVEAKNAAGTEERVFSIKVLETDNEFILAPVTGKNIGDGNPLITQRFGADPGWVVYDGRLYIYMTNDTPIHDGDGNVVDNSFGNIVHINVISSDDLMNWTDHGSIPVAGTGGIAPWAGNSWAPSVTYKEIDGKDTFFLYFANSGNGVGVIRGESPVGPWDDPIGKNLVSHSTPNCGSFYVPWCFDPAVYIDDDGAAYLYFGGGVPANRSEDPGSARVVRLGDDMVSIVGTPEEIFVPYFFEALDMVKHGDTYYLTYCSNWQGPGGTDAPGAAQIAYMTGSDPMGPFEYRGVILRNPGAMFNLLWNNNHQSVIKYMGNWYLLYHATLVSDALGLRNPTGAQVNYRSTHINELVFGADSSIGLVEGDRAGVPQIRNLDPYVRVEAETIAWSGGITTVMEDLSMAETSNMFVTGIRNGSWTAVSKADFGAEGARSFTARVSGLRGGLIELRLGSADGRIIGSLPVNADSGWEIVMTGLTETITGIHDVYMLFHGPVNNVDLFDFDWWMFGLEEAPVYTGSEDAVETGAGADAGADGGSSGDGSDNNAKIPGMDILANEADDVRNHSWLIWSSAAVLVAAGCILTFIFAKKDKQKKFRQS